MSPLTIGENDAADHLTFEPSCKTRCGWAKRTSSPIAGPGKVHAPVPPTINGPNRLICLGRYLAIHAAELAVEPNFQILRRYRRSLLLCLEHSHRSALEDHVRRAPRLGERGLFNVRIGIRPDCGDTDSSAAPSALSMAPISHWTTVGFCNGCPGGAARSMSQGLRVLVLENVLAMASTAWYTRQCSHDRSVTRMSRSGFSHDRLGPYHLHHSTRNVRVPKRTANQQGMSMPAARVLRVEVMASMRENRSRHCHQGDD